MRPDYCPCLAEDLPEALDPCPACGATVEGNDRVKGVCQAKHQMPPPYQDRAALEAANG